MITKYQKILQLTVLSISIDLNQKGDNTDS